MRYIYKTKKFVYEQIKTFVYNSFAIFSHDEVLKSSHLNELSNIEIRQTISQTITQSENLYLKPFLRFDYDTSFTPQEWHELMSMESDLACDLPFAQLTADILERDIILFPILQSDVEKKEDEKNVTPEVNEKTEKMPLTIFAKKSDPQHLPLTMLYFPEYQFGPDAYFQSIDINCIDKLILKNRGNYKGALEEQDEGDNKDGTESSDEEEDDFNTPNTTIKGNGFNKITALTPQDNASSIIINDSEKPIQKKLKRGKDAPIYEIAPGEGKKPEEWLREPSFDIEAFPHLHADGKNGLLDEDRPKPITPAKFFPQRILNIKNAFAKDHDYIFMAHAYMERYALEKQIDMSLLHGSVEKTEDDQVKIVSADDKYAIFQNIPGTPAYWKKFRNEIYARMEQLGPFHLFYTLSCAEMRWPSVLAEVLRIVEKDIEIIYPEKWDGKAESITVKTSKAVKDAINLYWTKRHGYGHEQVNLAVYKDWYLHQKKISMTDLVKDHFILITRIFNKRVKDFHNDVMKKKGIVNFCYRVEFQMRGLPHIHGVAWLDKENIKDCLNEEGIFREDKEGEESIINLIDEWMQCSLNFGHGNQEKKIKELNAKLKEATEKKYTLEAELNKLKQELKECNKKITQSEDYFNISTLKAELKSLRLAKKLLDNDTKKGKTKLKGKKKAKTENSDIDELDQQIKEVQHQLKIYNERDEISSLNRRKKSIEDEIKSLREKQSENEIDPNIQKEKDARELNDLVKAVNTHHHTKSCKKYGNNCR